jgi:hypothetical protein
MRMPSISRQCESRLVLRYAKKYGLFIQLELIYLQ